MNNLIKRGVVVAVIFLFIGLAFSPSINADISKVSLEDELVEITTEICGIDGVKPYSMKLTKQESIEIEQLFNEIKSKLDKVETREEAVEIFNEAVVELDNYGLLGGLSVKLVQKLTTGIFFKPLLTRLIRSNNYFKNGIIWEPDVINYLCLFTAYTIDAFEINIWGLLASLVIPFYNIIPLNIFYLLNFLLITFGHIKPFRLLNQIDIGVGVAWSYFTFGVLGKINGSYDFHTADGFSGIKIISKQEPREAYYLGFALRVTEKPF